MEIRGARGFLRWYAYAAAEVRDYTLTKSGRGYGLAGWLAGADAFKLSQRPLLFEVPVKGGGVWRWPVESLTTAEGKVSARLGPQDLGPIVPREGA
jgi:hypothetical protein